MTFEHVVEIIGFAVDGAGVVIIVIGVVVATAHFLRRMRTDADSAYTLYRTELAQGILLGLEFLIAGDIIRTVATTPTFESVGVLALIVLIRSFLSVTLTMEVQGRLPWKGDTREQQ